MLVISATDKMADIAKVLRLGVQDVLLKPLTDLNRLREAVLACLYPNMFTSQAIEEVELFQDWDALSKNPSEAVKLLKQLQPPVQQTIAHCRINYRQLTTGENPGLVLDIAALSEKDLAFYCWTSRAPAIMAYWRHCCCAHYLMGCCKTIWLINNIVCRKCQHC